LIGPEKAWSSNRRNVCTICLPRKLQ